MWLAVFQTEEKINKIVFLNPVSCTSFLFFACMQSTAIISSGHVHITYSLDYLYVDCYLEDEVFIIHCQLIQLIDSLQPTVRTDVPRVMVT